MTQAKHFHGGRIEATKLSLVTNVDMESSYGGHGCDPQPVAALAGNFPHLEVAGPPPNGGPVKVPSRKWCPGCCNMQPEEMFRYASGAHSKGAARCSDCRGESPNARSPRSVTNGRLNLRVYPSTSSTTPWPEKLR